MRCPLAALALLVALPALAAPEKKPDEELTVVGQRPAPVAPTTSYWVEDAYTDYPLLGPTFAQGLVIWNHANYYNNLGPAVPPIRAMEGTTPLSAKYAGDIFTAELAPDRIMRGVRHEGLWRITLDQEDGTRVVAVMHRLSGNS
jgi:hypothetical protein